jgi:hypothetical protein
MQQVVTKQTVLRTSFHVDLTTNEWHQQIEELNDEGYTFAESEISMTNYVDALSDLLILERAPGLFTMEGNRRVRLHVVRRRTEDADDRPEEGATSDVLHIGDVIIITVRHEAIDYTSQRYFLDDLAQAYKMGLQPIRSNAITYLDYTLYERQIDRSSSFAYWKEQHRTLNLAQLVSRIPSDYP